MEYSFLIKEENNVIIPNVPNAGIYKNEIGDNFSGKPWGNDYLNKKESTL